MDALPGDDFEESRAALAPTLEATAAILPWLARPAQPRFPPELNRRWSEAGSALAAAWSERHRGGDIRPALFALYAVAVDSGDADCLRLAEALAGAGDRLDDAELPPRLVAALSAAAECLADPAGLEQDNFPERARHFAQRLDAALRDAPARSAVIDRLFIAEAQERIEQMRDALAVLPPDAYALKAEAEALAALAEQLEIWGVAQLARDLAAAARAGDLDGEAERAGIAGRIDALERAVAAVDA